MDITGRGAVWLARMTGGHEVAGSSPVAPITTNLCYMGNNPLISHIYLEVSIFVSIIVYRIKLLDTRYRR